MGWTWHIEWWLITYAPSPLPLAMVEGQMLLEEGKCWGEATPLGVGFGMATGNC